MLIFLLHLSVRVPNKRQWISHFENNAETAFTSDNDPKRAGSGIVSNVIEGERYNFVAFAQIW